jgi:hypothetical protein
MAGDNVLGEYIQRQHCKIFLRSHSLAFVITGIIFSPVNSIRGTEE